MHVQLSELFSAAAQVTDRSAVREQPAEGSPDTYENPMGDDSRDSDAVQWLLTQPGASTG